MRPRPPKLAERLIRLVARPSDRDAVTQDLQDEFEAMLAEGTPMAEARRWYVRQVLGSVIPLASTRRGPLPFLRELLAIDGLARDVKVGARMLLKRRGFAAIAICTLALGIGSVSAVFSLVHGVLLTPPPYDDPNELVLVVPAYQDGREGLPPDWAPEQWLTWRDEVDQLEGVTAYLWGFSYVISDDGSEAVEGMRVTHDYFETLGLEPVLGRVFSQTETGGDEADPAVVISYEMWMDRFGGSPDVLGQPLPLSRESPTPLIVGVMPADIRFLPVPSVSSEPNYDVHARVDYWLPANVTWASDESFLVQRGWSVVGRLRDGVAPEAAAAQLNRVAATLAEAQPRYEGVGVEVQTVPEFMNAEGRRVLLPLFAAAALVLLIACGNAAALLLVRGLQRRGELGVRSAIGAGRAALVRLISIESLLLALAGSLLGIGLALAVVEGLKGVGSSAIPRLDSVTVGWPVLLFGFGAAFAATILAGLYPAFSASRPDRWGTTMAGLRTTAGLGERRLLSTVTTAQAALTLTLLVGAGLLVRTMDNLAGVDAGYETERILTMSVTAVEGDWADFHERALAEVSAVPGVEGAAFVWGVPLTGNSWNRLTHVQDPEAQVSPDEMRSVPVRSVTDGYFDIFGRAVVEGRGFNSADDDEAEAVAIVNEAFAQEFFEGRQPIGRTVTTPGWRGPFLVVGVVNDARTDDLTRRADPEIYLPFFQAGAFSKHLVVRTADAPAALGVDVQQALRRVDPTVAAEQVMTMGEIRRESLALQTFAMQLLISFAVVACVLTLGGVYGVLTLSVASRRRELAIRKAMGAEGGRLLALVLKEGAKVVALGLVIGLGAAVPLARVLRVFLFEVEPTDPTTLVAVASLFAAVAMLACWLPARRAAGMDPLEALREE